MNYVVTGAGRLIEVQATAETAPFSREELEELLVLATRGVELIGVAQEEALVAARA
jgi:ribonuclease PH